MGNNVNAQIERTVEGAAPLAKTVIVVEEEAAAFERKINALVREVEQLRAENQALRVYEKIYKKFAGRIHSIFSAVAHAAEGGGAESV